MKGLATALRRRRVDRLLRDMSKARGDAAVQSVLVDGVWDNPNYWVRYALVRRALELSAAREVGVTGPYNATRVARTLRRLGVREVVCFPALAAAPEESRRRARELLAATREPQDILRWRLPHGVPADYVYDGILKRQRRGVVALDDPRLPAFVAEALDCISAAERLFDTHAFELAVVSHQCNFLHTALVWLALSRRIPVLLIWGIYGTPRFTKLTEPAHLWRCADVPSREELAGLDPRQAARLADAGFEALKRRLAGHADDSGAIEAYARRSVRMDREEACRRLGLDAARPLVAVYAPNWFDYPHGSGLGNFRDYHDWAQVTAAAARSNRGVNWLFKRHPWDDWYGGSTLRDVVPDLAAASHAAFVPDDWNGASVLECADALVTCQGTAGIEFAAMGKPVLAADAGWYDHAGFVKLARSRAEYLELLACDWWRSMDVADATRRARVFAGFHFAHPRWQGSFLLPDDIEQWDIYRRLPVLIAGAGQALDRELREIRAWYGSNCRGYHTYKMTAANAFVD
jgi:hypothetical protein